MRVPPDWTGPKTPTRPITAGPQIGQLSFAQLVTMLSGKFLPASYGTAPLAQGTSGNRVTAVTSQSTYVKTVNGESGEVNVKFPEIQTETAALVAGTYTWVYPDGAFGAPPIVIPIPVGAPPFTASTPPVPAIVYPGTPSDSECIITSTNAADSRVLMLVAIATS